MQSLVADASWTGSTGKALRDAGGAVQRMAMYLITGPSRNMIGLYHLPIVVATSDLALQPGQALALLRQCQELGFCLYDTAWEHVFVIEMAKWQLGPALKPRDNRVKAVLRILESMQASPFYPAFLEKYSDAYHLHDLAKDRKSRPASRQMTLSCILQPARTPVSPARPTGKYAQPKVLEAWELWEKHVLHVRQRPLSDVDAEILLREMKARGVEKFVRDILFSIRVGAKSLRNSNHDYDGDGRNNKGRGDALTKQQRQRENIRYHLVKKGIRDEAAITKLVEEEMQRRGTA